MRVGLRIVGVEKGVVLRHQVANKRTWWHAVDYDGYAVGGLVVGLTCLWGDQQSRFLSQDTGSGRGYLTRSREGGFCMDGGDSHVGVV
jgi:hypothetical protein